MPVVGRLDQFGSMLVTSEFDEVNYTTVSVGAGQSSFTTPGTYSWTVPTGVVTISVVAVGAGGGGVGRGSGAGGGALAYTNDISVTPGETLTVGVGTSGLGANTGIAFTGSDGENSYLKRGATSLVEAGGGKKGIAGTGAVAPGAGGTVIVGTGGSGGAGGPGDSGGAIEGSGGGGAGGYSGSGGQGGQGSFGPATAGSGGGGGGGETSSTTAPGGGGVGINGQGTNGLGGSGGGGGSGGSAGQIAPSNTVAGNGGLHGGGGGSGDTASDIGGNGGSGAVRIIWGVGANRYFPQTNTADFPTNYTTVKPSISGLGTYTALQFSENVGTATTIRANVFAPYQIVDDEFAGVLYGPGQGTFMRQELTGNVVVYNEINEIGLDPSYTIIPNSLSINEGSTATFTIFTNNVPDGTQLYYEIVDPIGSAMNLDVFNASSYNGSGTAWTDVSGTSNSGTLTNGPTYNSLNGGSIVLSGVNDYINLSNKPLPLINVSQFTYSTFIKIISGSTYGMFFSFGQSASYANDITFYYYPTNGTLNFQVNNGGDGGASFAYTIGSWSHISVVYDGTQVSNVTRLKVYLNGILQTLTFDGGYTVPATTSSTVFTDAAIGIYSTSGFTNDTHMTGSIRTAQLYNKALSASQILQNYNTLNNRYSELVLNLDAGNASSYPGSGTTWTDLSSGKNGTLVNGPTYSSANGGCIIFDGANDYVNIGVGKGVNQFSGDFAISVWVMADSTGSTFGNIVGDYYTGSVSTTNEWQLMMSNGAQISFYRVGTGSIFNIASGYSANTWINVVVSRIGSTITLYTNSNSIATATNSNIFGTATGNLNIGIDGNNAQEPFKGRIADVKIYDKGLSASEVLQKYNSSKDRFYPPIVTSGLVMNLDAGNASSYPGSGTTWTDVSGNSNTGTLTNGPTYSSANNGSIVFAGTDDYINLPANSINTNADLTLSFWLKASSFTSANTILSGLNNTGHLQIRFGTSITLTHSYIVELGSFTGFTPAINTIYNLTFILTKGALDDVCSLYVNGSFVSSVTYTKPTFTISQPVLGVNYTVSEPFSGNMYNFMSHNRVLSVSEILQNYNALRGRYGL